VRQTELEGDWQVIKAVLSGRDITDRTANVRYDFQGEALVRTEADGVMRVSQCTVTPSARPKQITIVPQTLEPPSSAARRRGIYRFDGNQLIIAFNVAQPDERPRGFASGPENSIEVITLERR
jgi:uncharacterized protein (TIGR03067 family)